MAQIQGGHCPCSKIQGGRLTTLPPPCRAPGSLPYTCPICCILTVYTGSCHKPVLYVAFSVIVAFSPFILGLCHKPVIYVAFSPFILGLAINLSYMLHSHRLYWVFAINLSYMLHSHRLYWVFAINLSRTSSGSATEMSSPTKINNYIVPKRCKYMIFYYGFCMEFVWGGGENECCLVTYINNASFCKRQASDSTQGTTIKYTK